MKKPGTSGTCQAGQNQGGEGICVILQDHYN